MSEVDDRAVVIEHHYTDTCSWEVVDWNSEALVPLEVSLEASLAWHEEISAVVLITKGVSSDDNGFFPSTNQPGHILDDDWFTEDGTVKVVTDGSIGTLPHLLEIEFLDSCLIWSDGRTLDTNLAFLNGLGRLQCDLVISFISVFDSEIKVADVQVEERMDELIFNLLPNDSGHLITIEFGDWICDLDLGERLDTS